MKLASGTSPALGKLMEGAEAPREVARPWAACEAVRDKC